MNEQVQKQLLRQLKLLNFWITFFGTLGVIAIIALAFVVFQLVAFIGETNAKLEGVKQEISQSTDIKKQVCGEESSLRRFLEASGVCS